MHKKLITFSKMEWNLTVAPSLLVSCPKCARGGIIILAITLCSTVTLRFPSTVKIFIKGKYGLLLIIWQINKLFPVTTTTLTNSNWPSHDIRKTDETADKWEEKWNNISFLIRVKEDPFNKYGLWGNMKHDQYQNSQTIFNVTTCTVKLLHMQEKVLTRPQIYRVAVLGLLDLQLFYGEWL